MKKLSFCLVLIMITFTSIIFSGCNDNKVFEHKKVNIDNNSQYSYFEVQVTNIEQGYALTDYGLGGNQFIEATINIKNVNKDNQHDVAIRINDFDFYLSIPNITYHTTALVNENNTYKNLTFFVIKSNTTATIKLRIDFDTSKNFKEDNEIKNKGLYTIKFLNTRI